MKANTYEIEQAGHAMVTLMDIAYTQEQLDYIIQFLNGHALDLNDVKMAKLFKNLLPGMDAIRALHDFACQFQNEEDLFDEFQAQLEHIALNIQPTSETGGIAV